MPPRTRIKAPSMTLESRAVADLLADPRNAMRHDERNIDTIRASLRLFGQQKNIVILPDGVVIAGNGTLTAAKAEGWKQVDVKIFTGTLDEARAFGIIDNRSAQLAQWDTAALGGALGDLDAAGVYTHDVLGFTDPERDRLADFDPNADADTSPQLGGIEYKIVIECRDEAHQQNLLRRLDAEGISCRAVMV